MASFATVMKFGDRSPLDSTMPATSLVADVRLIGAATVWGYLASQAACGAAQGIVIPLRWLR